MSELIFFAFHEKCSKTFIFKCSLPWIVHSMSASSGTAAIKDKAFSEFSYAALQHWYLEIFLTLN